CLRLRKSPGAERGPCNQAPSKEIAHGPPPSLHSAHGPLAAIGSRAGVGVDRTRALLPRCRTCASEGRAAASLFRSFPHEREPRSPSQRRCAHSCPCLSRRVQSRCSPCLFFPVNNRRKTGAVNATPRESTGNRDGGRKRTGNNRAVTGKSQAPTS